jgi:hypothetical protein
MCSSSAPLNFVTLQVIFSVEFSSIIFDLRKTIIIITYYSKSSSFCSQLLQISLLPSKEAEVVRRKHLHLLLANRSAAHKQLKRFDKAAADAEACTRVNHNIIIIKTHYRTYIDLHSLSERGRGEGDHVAATKIIWVCIFSCIRSRCKELPQGFELGSYE